MLDFDTHTSRYWGVAAPIKDAVYAATDATHLRECDLPGRCTNTDVSSALRWATSVADSLGVYGVSPYAWRCYVCGALEDYAARKQRKAPIPLCRRHDRLYFDTFLRPAREAEKSLTRFTTRPARSPGRRAPLAPFSLIPAICEQPTPPRPIPSSQPTERNPMSGYPMSDEEWTRLSREAEMPDGLGEMFTAPCDVTPETSYIQARRVGFAGRGLESRAAIHAFDTAQMFATVYVSADAARKLGAHLLNIADEIDGVTPLVFFPRAAGESDEDTGGEAFAVDTWREAYRGESAMVLGDDADAGHHFRIGERVEILDVWVKEDEGVAYAWARSDESNLEQFVALNDLDIRPAPEPGTDD